MSHAIGIDIGTHASAIAIVEGGEARVLDTGTGASREPSWLTLAPSGPMFGEPARGRAQDLPRHTVFGLLRLAGRKYFSPEMDWIRSTSALPIVSAANGDAHVHIAGRDYSPTELLSHQLEHLRRRAEKQLGASVDRAAIAVAASFDDLQRRALLNAAKLAGFEEASLVDTVTAAAIGWTFERPASHRLAILDFGAGSFDVALVDCQGRVFEQLAAAGDPMLGGDDMDRRLVLHFLEHHRATSGVDAGEDPAALHGLFELARSTRRDLSRAPAAVPIRFTLGSSGVLEHPGLSREQLEELVETELAGIQEPCMWAFEDAGLGTDDVDAVLLLGGLAAMPGVSDLVAWLFRRPPEVVSPKQNAVARGAAHVAYTRHAAGVRRASSAGFVAVREVAAQSTGVKVRGGRFMPILHRASALPAAETKVFQTNRHTKGRVVFELYQGEHEVAAENIYVGRFALSSLDPESPFAIAFHYDQSGLVEVGQVDLQDGTETPVEIARAGGLDGDELATVQAQREERSRPGPRRPTSSVPRKTFRIESSPDPGETRTRRRTRAVDSEARPRRHSEAPRSSAPPGPSHPPPGVVRATPEGMVAPSRSLATSRTVPSAGLDGDETIEVGSDSLVGTTLSNRYVIEDVLGEGGMGRVYLARHELLRKRFAIKVLHPELAANKDLAERFIREAQAASAIDSQHVVDISDFGQLDDGTGYFVMEHLDGRNLEELLDLQGPQAADLTITVGVQVADALRGAHDAQIVHRDLKPSNIVLLERSHKPFAKICDFGIAKSPTSDSQSHGNSVITMVGVMMGTPHYMAPEQIDGEVDPRSDIYALGIVLYEMLTGSPPFDAESVAEVLAHHKWTEPPPLLETNPTVNVYPDLEQVVMRCLAKEASDRFQSAPDVAAALQACGQSTHR